MPSEPRDRAYVDLGELAPGVQALREVTGFKTKSHTIWYALYLLLSGQTLESAERRRSEEFNLLDMRCGRLRDAATRAHNEYVAARSAARNAVMRGAGPAVIQRVDSDERRAISAYFKVLEDYHRALDERDAFLNDLPGVVSQPAPAPKTLGARTP